MEEVAPQSKTPMPGGWKPVTELESNILTAQTKEVLDISTRDFGWSGENIKLQPRMMAAARREAIRSCPVTPEPLISSMAMGRTKGINPTFGVTISSLLTLMIRHVTHVGLFGLLTPICLPLLRYFLMAVTFYVRVVTQR